MLKLNLLLVIFLVLSINSIVKSSSNGGDDDLDVVDDDIDDNSAQSPPPPPIEKPKYVKPVVKGDHHFQETFDSKNSIGSKWMKSTAKKEDVDEVIGKYEGEWSIESSTDSVLDGDEGLVLKSKAKHHAISAKLLKPFDFNNKKPLVVQYEVKFQNPLECGGAYIKLLTHSENLKLENFYDKTPYTIMFGPDKCGQDAKYHFILRHKNPITGTFEEKHAKKSENIEPFFSDGRTHLFTLILNPDNTFKMLIDQIEFNKGSLLTDLTPPINPEKEIVDPNDKKPEGWDDREKIVDPDATKPADWDETEPKQIIDTNAVKPSDWLDNEESTIPDTSAVKPDDWDDDTDGEWEPPKIDNPNCAKVSGCGEWKPPKIDNPKYKGKWFAPMIDNPSYQGKWEPRKIPNPDYFEDKDPFSSITPFSSIGLELWSMTDNIYFDNFIITDDESVANEFAKEGWTIKAGLELKNSKAGESVVDGLINATREKPWLWAVYVLVALVPIVLIAVFCFGSSKSTVAKPEERKKTDEATPDDQQEEEAAVAADAANEPERVEEPVEEQEAPVAEEEKPVSPRKRNKGRKE